MRGRSIHLANWQTYSTSLCGSSVDFGFEQILPGKCISPQKKLLPYDDGQEDTLRIGSLLGQGGYGQVFEVWRASSPSSRFALKVPRKTGTKSYIENEIQKLNLLCKDYCPYIPQVKPFFFSWENTIIPCFITHVYSPLEKQYPQLLDQERLELIEALKLFYMIAQGLKYITSHHIIHNDIKPGNLMYHQGKPIITDYGTARSNSEINEIEIERLMGRLHGTPFWLPPELVTVMEEPRLGEFCVYYNLGKVCQKTDVWGLGLVLMALVAGKSLFEFAHQKIYPSPEIFFHLNHKFTKGQILQNYRKWAAQNFYLPKTELNINNYELYELSKEKSQAKEILEESLENQLKKKQTSKHILTIKKAELKRQAFIQSPSSSHLAKDFLVSSIFTIFDLCTAPLPKRIKIYRLVSLLDNLYPNLKEATNSSLTYSPKSPLL